MAEAALKLEYEESENKLANINVHNNQAIVKKKNKRRNILLKIFYSSFALLSLASAIFILSNYEKITSLNFEIREINGKILDKEKVEMNLVAKIENIKSSKDIVAEASTKLGMVFPEEDQVVYFTLNDGEINKKEEGLVANIFSTFTGKND